MTPDTWQASNDFLQVVPCGLQQKHIELMCWGRAAVAYLDYITYLQTSNISHTLVSNKIVDHSDVVGTSSVGAASTSPSF